MDVIEWLIEGDAAVRWQALRDLADAPADQVAAERGRVAHEGWGARLLESQREDGHWDVEPPAFESDAAVKWWGTLQPGQRGTLMPTGTSTTWTLALLKAFGADPADASVRRAVDRVREHCLWEHDAQPYFEGEVEPCINGRTVALGAYFGQDVEPIVARLLTEQMQDGGWNCEQENGSTRGSFHTTVDVLEGLLEFERAAEAAGQDTAILAQAGAARLRGQEYLLERRLTRSLSTGEPIEHDRKTEARSRWSEFSFPTFWHYDVLRGLDHLRAAGAAPDERAADAVALVASKRGAAGRWPAENPHPARSHFPLDDGEGAPSRWNTLRALRVLRWYEGAARA
ncbi:hypothetical protein KDL01_11345 [Actinospica durhamensis]|uniref:Squalene cyclase n=1 Tax=Actinospica durhamensis TaxID=1508375 RepID=A0A941IM81_9ACTN|nr:hypothetical protein [Actinospica durhamensis]MBR7833865.1 hypothetical protein [Actinospica durhamensis]